MAKPNDLRVISFDADKIRDAIDVNLEELTDLDSDDLDTVAEQLPGAIAWTGRLLALARKNLAIAEAEYRAWRGSQTNAVITKDQKLAEWKAKAKVEGDARFTALKVGVAEEQERVDSLDSLYTALLKKANMIQTIAANARSARDSA